MVKSQLLQCVQQMFQSFTLKLVVWILFDEYSVNLTFYNLIDEWKQKQWSHCVSLSGCHLSFLKTHISLTDPGMFGIKIEREVWRKGVLTPSALWITMMTKCIIQWCLPEYYYIKKSGRYFCGYPVYIA